MPDDTMPEITIEGACNIDDEQTCPDCGGWKDKDDDLCDDCTLAWEDDDRA